MPAAAAFHPERVMGRGGRVTWAASRLDTLQCLLVQAGDRLAAVQALRRYRESSFFMVYSTRSTSIRYRLLVLYYPRGQSKQQNPSGPSSAGLPFGDRTVISLGGIGQSAPLRCVGAILIRSLTMTSHKALSFLGHVERQWRGAILGPFCPSGTNNMGELWGKQLNLWRHSRLLAT